MTPMFRLFDLQTAGDVETHGAGREQKQAGQSFKSVLSVEKS